MRVVTIDQLTTPGFVTPSGLTVVREAKRNASGKRCVIVRCFCGGEKRLAVDAIRDGQKSCGCLKRGKSAYEVARW